MPATADALVAGRIGTEKARLLATASAVNGFVAAETGLVDCIVGVTLRTARRIVGRFVADHRDTPPANPAANEVTLTPKRDGRWRLSGDLDHETATVLANELRRLADAYRDDEGLGLAHRSALALLDMARRSITLGERGPGSRPSWSWSPTSATATSPTPATRTAAPSPARCSRTSPATPPSAVSSSTVPVTRST